MKEKEYSLEDNISSAEKDRLIREGIARGVKDIEQGRIVPHERVMNGARELIENWEKRKKSDS
ncbi:hypothetical protein [Flagellimonas sp.]|uniref:hypothetical protein n=1 Tax=Flagellimonas sp. TaxID=2058762 RepID=UPI003BB02424